MTERTTGKRGWRAMRIRIPAGVVAGWQALARIALGRLVVLLCLLLALSALIPRDEPAFYAFIALAFVINIPYALWLRDSRRARESAPLQFVVDTLIVTGLVYFTGGIDSELCLLYPLVIVSAGIVGGGWLTARITLLSICLYALVIVLQLTGIPGVTPAPLPESPVATVQRLFLRVLTFAFFSAASTFLASRCRFQARELRSYRDLVETVFHNVQVALLACRKDGVIVLANPAAAAMVGLPEDSLAGRNVREFLPLEPSRMREQTEEASATRIVRLKCADGSSLPVAVAVAEARLPRTVAPTGVRRGERGGVWIVAADDVSDAERAREAERRLAEMQGALKVTAEFAHAVRNPLTSLRAGVEALAMLASSVLAEKEGADDPRLAPLNKLTETLMTEMTRLDERIDEFLQVASSKPEQLLQRTAARHLDQLADGTEPPQGEHRDDE